MEDYTGTTPYDVTQEVSTSGNVYLYDEGQVIVLIRKWLFCPVGIVGNILCIILLVRPPMNRLMMTPYLIVISVNDFFYLFSDIVNEIVFKSGWTTTWYCMLMRYIADVCGSLSDLLVAVVAIHRAIAVSMPLKSDRYCRPSAPKQITAIVSLIVLLLFLEVFWIAETDPLIGFCRDKPGSSGLVALEAAIIMGKTILAVVTIAVSSVIILHNLRQQTETMTPHCAEDRLNKTRKSKDEQIGTMLLSISILFLVTNVPLAIFFVVRTIIEIELWLDEFIYVLTLTLKNLNHVLNFLFYCFSAQMFRTELKRLFICDNCCTCKKTVYIPTVSSIMGHSEAQQQEHFRHKPVKDTLSASTLGDTKFEFMERL